MERLSRGLRPPARRPDGAACLSAAGHDADDRRRRRAAATSALGGIAWSNEVSEDILYLVTLLSAPWLLRQGQHIRVDIVLRALPARLGWLLEWLGDMLGLACSLYFVWYGCEGAGGELHGRRGQDQDAGDAGMVAAGAAAGGLPAGRHRVRLPHAPAEPAPSGRRARMRCRRHEAGAGTGRRA